MIIITKNQRISLISQTNTKELSNICLVFDKINLIWLQFPLLITNKMWFNWKNNTSYQIFWYSQFRMSNWEFRKVVWSSLGYISLSGRKNYCISLILITGNTFTLNELIFSYTSHSWIKHQCHENKGKHSYCHCNLRERYIFVLIEQTKVENITIWS